MACFLDPRYKKKIVEFYMRKFYGDDYQSFINDFVDILRTLYPFYASSMPTPSKSNVNEQSNSTGHLEEN